MPRDLADVLHYFMPELGGDDPPPSQLDSPAVATRPPAPDPDSTSHSEALKDALPLAAVPIGEHEIVRASLVLSLADEVAALGGDTTVLTPNTADARRLFPSAALESTNARVKTTRADNLSSLYSAARELAAVRGASATNRGVILVRIPPMWLRGAHEASELLDWLLLFSATDSRSLADTYAVAAWVLGENPKAEIGVTIHGAEDHRSAEEAFGALARNVEQRLGRTLANYGLLVEDLDLYRSLVSSASLCRTGRRSLAAAGLREAAKLVYERARKAQMG